MRFAMWLLLVGCDYTWNLDHIDDKLDARVFDLETDCPETYDLAFVPGSRFRIAQTERPAWGVYDVCSRDRPGFTHPATAPTRAKLDALIGALTARQVEFRWWLGAVQPTSATLPGADWLWVTGEPVDPTLWFGPDEPNDGNNFEDDHEDQFAFIETGDSGLIDARGSTLQRGLCECDGRSNTVEAQAAVDQSRL